MKKYIILSLIVLLFPICVNAESHYLYDVLKNEAESNGLAREYTGEHHDSYNREPSKKIYHWYAETDDEGTQVNGKNNVIFANKCWRIIRTTDTGGVKMIYKGNPNNNNCSSSGPVGYPNYNSNISYLAEVGYMYNDAVVSRYKKNSLRNNNLFGKYVTYSNGVYTLVDTSETIDRYHHYTCPDSTGSCEAVRYYIYSNNVSTDNNIYLELNNGRNITETIDSLSSDTTTNSNDSSAKLSADSWYRQYLIDYSDYLEETIFCNERGVYEWGFFNQDGGTIYSLGTIFQFKSSDPSYDLACSSEYNKFSIYNPKAKLNYSIALPTSSEMMLLNNNNIRKLGHRYWTMSPHGLSPNGTSVKIINTDGSVTNNLISQSAETGTNPVISLIPNIKYSTGDGSITNPYIIEELVKSNIIINNDTNKGTLNIDKTNNIVENSNVTFTVIPNNGYLLKKIEIRDSDNNIINHQSNNNEYSFTMPPKNVTITTIYEKEKNSINVEIVNETEDLNINIDDLSQVEEGEEVTFKVTPIKGFKIKSIRIVDEDNTQINYSTTDNKTYTFIMPNKDVTIIPSYEKVKNAVNVENNNNTKEFIIEVNDATAVVYEDTVRFKVEPEDGYEVESIDIRDEENNKISYRKTNNTNEYEFTMPDTDVLIKPKYRKIESNSNSIPNPNTKRQILFIIISIITLIVITYIGKKKRLN